MEVDKCSGKFKSSVEKDCRTVIKAKDIKKRVFGDANYIGVLFKDGEKGFVFKKSENEYSVVQIDNNSYLSQVFYKTIRECLSYRPFEIKRVVIFYERKDLVKWVGKEK